MVFPVPDVEQDNDTEPDFTKYASIDMSTLRDVRKTGMDYVLSMEALLHTTPGLEPGYLPEKDALSYVEWGMYSVIVVIYLPILIPQ